MAPNNSNYSYDQVVIKGRKVDHEIHPLIHSRWSPYALTGRPIDDATLSSLFEAARWAPSCYNTQNWRYVYAKRDTDHWPVFLDTLMEMNQKWAQNASAIIVTLSKKTFIYQGNVTPQPWNSFDTGAAWMALALEASARGLVAHCMGGYEKDKVVKAIGLDRDDFQVEAVIAVGYPAPEGTANEKISQRNPLEKFVAEGKFTDKLH